MSGNISQKLDLSYNFTKEQIDSEFAKKVKSILKSTELSKLDKKILLNEYYNMYKNSILVKNKDNKINKIYSIKTKNNNYYDLSNNIDKLLDNDSKIIITYSNNKII